MLVQVTEVSDLISATSKGGHAYNYITVGYEANGKASSKRIVDFAEVYAAFKDATPGSTFDVVVKKNGQNYDWVSATPSTEAANGHDNAAKEEAVRVSAKTSSYTKRPTSTYETPEERAARQELIVRQSSITAALTFLSYRDEGKAFSMDETLATAKQFRNFVYGVEPTARVS